ncbi:hypothetical protein OXI21_01210 [Ignatzschineria sp. RMDPL8A]|uniref:hypothetical protein n=1 Tax=Ignatzschineria sp. RMDPL8A TaxID=2999236 RepID=UPI0024466813|nr:hypothetical protein [Ignatzschineria sp. RMDPL8A]MDG9729043.1 hypothetical protein [Ignatzschineria sp. RMDPL8A]
MERVYAKLGEPIQCAHCRYEISYGATICQGCQTHLIYGMPDGYFRYMKSQAMILGIVLTLVLWFLLIVLFPILYGFFIAPVIAILISWLLYRKSKRHAIATIPDNLVSFIPPEEIAVRTFRKAMK